MIKISPALPGGDEATPSITSQAYTRLRTDILTGAIAPGTKLKIEQLRQLLGSGASPIREALSLLTSDHLVERIDQRGFRVALVSEDEFQELLRTREWLEERALRESIARGDKAWEESVVLSHYYLSRTPRTTGESGGTSSVWERHHRALHFALLGACGSAIMLRFCEQLYDQNIRYRHLAGRAAYPKRNINSEHDAIVEATLNRDADAAVDALLSHYRRTGKFLSSRISG